MNIAYDIKNSIVLDNYMDLLFNDRLRSINHVNESQEPVEWRKKTRLEQYEAFIYKKDDTRIEEYIEGKEQGLFSGGLLLPCNENPGSGNILIKGQPGVGKSTLAFQIAAACASKINKGIAVYYSLEESSDHLIGAMCRGAEFSSGGIADIKHIHKMDTLSTIHTVPTSDELYKYLKKALKQDEHGILPQVFFPALSPRGIKTDEETNAELFWLRYKQLEYMLKAVKKYNEKESGENPLIKAMIIDSLDVFSEQILTREELYRIFSLFKKYGVLGIFTAEDHDGQQSNMDFAQYIADIVISLEFDEFNNYFCRYFEITKSRYVRQVNGKQPYKITSGYKNENISLKKEINVYPSMHYMIYATESRSKQGLTKSQSSNGSKSDVSSKSNDMNGDSKDSIINIFGIKQFDKILPTHFQNRNNTIHQVITIEGEGGMYKSDIAINALINGIIGSAGPQNGLIIRLSDRSSFAINGCRLSADITRQVKHNSIDHKKMIKIKRTSDDNSHKVHKYAIDVYEFPDYQFIDNSNAKLVEIAFKSGALLPEEFVLEVCRVINVHNIKRVAMVDIRSIGTSYPFLINSKTSGDMFLPTYIHIMRNYGIHLIMSCSRTKVAESNRHINKACALADAVLNCQYDKNENNVFITGEGSITDSDRYYITPNDSEKWSFSIENGEPKETILLSPFTIKKDN